MCGCVKGGVVVVNSEGLIVRGKRHFGGCCSDCIVAGSGSSYVDGEVVVATHTEVVSHVETHPQRAGWCCSGESNGVVRASVEGERSVGCENEGGALEGASSEGECDGGVGEGEGKRSAAVVLGNSHCARVRYVQSEDEIEGCECESGIIGLYEKGGGVDDVESEEEGLEGGGVGDGEVEGEGTSNLSTSGEVVECVVALLHQLYLDGRRVGDGGKIRVVDREGGCGKGREVCVDGEGSVGNSTD